METTWDLMNLTTDLMASPADVRDSSVGLMGATSEMKDGMTDLNDRATSVPSLWVV